MCLCDRLYKKPHNESLDKTNLYLSDGYKFYFQILFVVVGVWGWARSTILDFVPYTLWGSCSHKNREQKLICL